MPVHEIGPNAGLVIWTVGMVTLLGLLVTIGVRWLRLGRDGAITPPMRLVLAIAVLTVVWVYPGVVGAVVIGFAAIVRWAWARRPRSSGTTPM